ncbi:DUF805 domain-containing protein [Euryarchaeota archaeon]|nr:DUF805 domain-containing protein [Euryarchaeota archaeon]
MSKSNQELGPFGKSFIGDFPTVGSLSLLSFSFLLSALLSLGNLIPFLILFILSSSLTVLFTYNFIEPHFNSKPIINEIGRMNKTSFSLESIKRRFISGSERPKEIISFKDAIRSFFKNWANFRGRASRSEYNWSILFTNLMLIPLSLFYSILIGIILLLPESNPVASFFALIIMLISILLFVIFYLCLLIPSITILMRRLHDIGYSGWLYFLYILIYVVISVIFLQISYLVYVFISFILSIPLLMIMILPGDNMTNKYGPVPTNKLSIDGTNFSRYNYWDLSGVNIPKLFQSDVNSHELNFTPISQRKGPLIGDWEPETKIKTWLKVAIVFIVTNISLYLVLAISLLLVYGGYIDNLTSLYGLDIIISSFFFTSIILVTLYFENKFTYLRNLFSIPNVPKSVLLIVFVSVLDAILVICWIVFYDFIASPSSDSGYEEVANTTFGLILIFISFAITAPIFEEILFRGYLLDKIRSSYSDNFTIISTGFLFGMMHWNIFFWSDFAQVGSATIGGFLYAWLRIKTGSLWPSMICHSLWNGTIFILVFVI